MNQVIEKEIMKGVEQYMWLHRRFKHSLMKKRSVQYIVIKKVSLKLTFFIFESIRYNSTASNSSAIADKISRVRYARRTIKRQPGRLFHFAKNRCARQ